MLKKTIAGLVCLMCLITLCATGLTEIQYAQRVLDECAASQALLETYGITGGMQTYFVWQYEDHGDGSATVSATGRGPLNDVLGTYEVFLINSEVIEVSWSHEGANTEGMFTADVWGAEQLQAMLDEISKSHDTGFIYDQAEAIAQKHGAEDGPYASSRIFGDDPIALDVDAFLARNDEVLAQEALDPNLYEAIAKEAIVNCYVLNDAQKASLEDPTYMTVYGTYLLDTPVVLVMYGVGYGDEEIAWQEGDGSYSVAMEVQTGEVLATEYECGLSANG